MDGNRLKYLHYLQTVVDIQNITLEHTRRGITQIWVYKNIIHPQYRISKRTYYHYLGLPAKRELARLLREQEADGKPDGGTVPH